MKPNRKLLCILFALATVSATMLWQCATPTQPTGGEPDRSPPVVTETEPVSGTTNFDGERIRFYFDKYVNRDSFRDALRVEPDLDLDYEISWRRRRATVEFNEPLPDTTTMIFTVGTDLQDTRGNRFSTPYQLALSTGPEIDGGKITARVVDAETGEGIMGERLVLYRHPADLSESAEYVGESDSAGVVNFNYLREGRYKAFWLDDRNRNRRWDRAREAAQPLRYDTLTLDKDGEVDAGSVFVAREDTIPPVLQAVGMLSEVRLRLRFSENITYEAGAGISIFHEDDSFVTDAIPLFVDRDNPNVILAHARDPLPDEQSYTIELEGITDPSGNAATIGVDQFPGSDEPDTTFARYIGQDTRHGIAPDEPVIIRYAKVLEDTPDVLDSLIVVESQTTHEPWPNAETIDNLLFVYPDGEWHQGETYEIRVWDEHNMERRTIHPDILYPDQLGGLEVIIEEQISDTTEYQLTLVNEQGEAIRSETFTDDIELSGLPPGAYVLRVFEIREGARRWDSGRVDPFRAPARFFIQKDIPVERGLTGQVYVEWP